MNRSDNPKLITLVTILLLMVLASACGNEPATPTVTPTRTPTPTSPTPSGTEETTETTPNEIGLASQLVLIDELATLAA